MPGDGSMVRLVGQGEADVFGLTGGKLQVELALQVRAVEPVRGVAGGYEVYRGPGTSYFRSISRWTEIGFIKQKDILTPTKPRSHEGRRPGFFGAEATQGAGVRTIPG